MSRLAHPLFRADLGQLRKVSKKDVAVRFAFGAAISVVAGLAGHVFGPRLGGVLLAFPAILPATLTLLEQKEGTGAAVRDVGGAALGGVGLVSFAVVATVGLNYLPAPAALGAALGAWLATSLVLYLARAAHLLPFVKLEEPKRVDRGSSGDTAASQRAAGS